MKEIRWGILGPGTIANAFAKGLGESAYGTLVAVASRTKGRAEAFGVRYGVVAERCYAGYQALCADPDIDAIYVATPHPFHKEHALMVLGANKHLLLEKPAALNRPDVLEIVNAARAQELFMGEAYMYLHHPQIRAALEIVNDPSMGPVEHIRATFCFDEPFDPKSRLYDPNLAGGGIFDVGGYVMSAACLFAGAGAGSYLWPVETKTLGLRAESGVDALAMALLRFDNDITAEIACAVGREIGQRVAVHCKHGKVVLDTPWLPGNEAAPADSDIEIWSEGSHRTQSIPASRMLYAYEADAANLAIGAGRKEFTYPAISTEESLAMAALLDEWHTSIVG